MPTGGRRLKQRLFKSAPSCREQYEKVILWRRPGDYAAGCVNQVIRSSSENRAMKTDLRKFEPRDRQPVYRLFRESIWDYMLQQGLVGADDEPDVDEYFRQQRNLYLHLEQTAAEDWVAESDRGELLGWARAIERDNHLQLTHFFVSPAAQNGGIGRQLLQRTFAPNRGEQRSVIATTNTRALSLYLRHDVSFHGIAFSFYGKPQIRRRDSDLEVVTADASAETLDSIVEIDSQVLGYRRPVDLGFFMQHQPAFLFYAHGRPVAYAFGSDGYAAGPAAALEPQHLPPILEQIETSAYQKGMESLGLTIPAPASHAVNWALSAGYRLDPFYAVLLAKYPSMRLDRYIMTQSSFIW